MCGFACAFLNKPINNYLLHKVAKSIRHRGPDSLKTDRLSLTDGTQVSLSFARLAIQDISSSSNQPFYKDSVVLLFNGEIYNAQALRSKLSQQHGSTFTTTSDTEVILELYKKFGCNFVQELHGMYAIVLIDRDRNLIFAYRDRFGIKPLFISENADGIYLGSEIQAVAELTNEYNFDLNFLRRHTVIDPFIGFSIDSPFKKIRLVEPGTILTISNRQIVTRVHYYDLKNIASSYDYYPKERVREVLKSAVSAHMLSDVEVACTLSGGFDSSLISILAQQNGSQCKHFFTIDIDQSQSGFSEDKPFADLIYRQKLQTPYTHHKVLNVPSAWSLKLIDSFVKVLGTPLYDTRVLVWHSLYSAVREQNIKVILNGQGADELWYGYYPKIWSWFSILFHSALNRTNIINYLENTLKQSLSMLTLNKETLATFPSYCNDLADKLLSYSPDFDDHKHLTLYMAETVLPSLLRFEDALGMFHSVEVRVPFLDHRVVELALCLNSEQHLCDTKKGKDALKATFSDLLPPELLNRIKSPLPKPKSGSSGLARLFHKYISEIKKCSLISVLYDTQKLEGLLDQRDSSAFYGGLDDLLLQIISTWRFNEVFTR